LSARLEAEVEQQILAQRSGIAVPPKKFRKITKKIPAGGRKKLVASAQQKVAAEPVRLTEQKEGNFFSNETDFTEILKEKCGKSKKFLLSRIEYEKIIQELKEASSITTKKTRRQYSLMEKYEILECGDVEKLIRKRVSKESAPVYFVAIEDTHQVLNRAHLATGHGGRDRMHKYLSEKYANVQLESIELFKSFCLPCQEKKNKKRVQGIVVKPILSKDFNSRVQIDRIDMQSGSGHDGPQTGGDQVGISNEVALESLPSLEIDESSHDEGSSPKKLKMLWNSEIKCS